jgi:hypothetical protein
MTENKFGFSQTESKFWKSKSSDSGSKYCSLETPDTDLENCEYSEIIPEIKLILQKQLYGACLPCAKFSKRSAPGLQAPRTGQSQLNLVNNLPRYAG